MVRIVKVKLGAVKAEGHSINSSLQSMMQRMSLNLAKDCGSVSAVMCLGGHGFIGASSFSIRKIHVVNTRDRTEALMLNLSAKSCIKSPTYTNTGVFIFSLVIVCVKKLQKIISLYIICIEQGIPLKAYHAALN